MQQAPRVSYHVDTKYMKSSFPNLISSIAAAACIKLAATLILFPWPMFIWSDVRTATRSEQISTGRQKTQHFLLCIAVTQHQTANNSAVCALLPKNIKKAPNSLCGYVALVKPFNKSAGNVRTHAYIYSHRVQCIRCYNHLARNGFFIKNIRHLKVLATMTKCEKNEMRTV